MTAASITERPASSPGELADHLAFLGTLSHSFAASVDVDATLEQALLGITSVLAVEAGTLFLRDEATGELVCRASIGPISLDGLRLRPDEGIVGRCVARNAVEIVQNAADDPGFLRRVDESSGFVTRGILCAPMAVGAERLGAIEILNKRDGSAFDEHDVNLLQVMSSSAALAISNARMAKALVEQERLRRELELAAEIQRSLLPRGDGFGYISGLNRPIRQVSGDFFDYFVLPSGQVPFALGDVAGKGLNAALLMAKTASLFRCLGKSVHDPAALLANINREICETGGRGMFVTMVAGTYDPVTGQLRFANAGHLPPLLRRPDRSYINFPAQSPPLGVESRASFENHEVNLEGGEFYVYSDGLTEYRYGASEELGIDGLVQLLASLSSMPLAERLTALVAELDHAGWESRDDLTVLAIDDSHAGEVPSDERRAARPEGEAELLIELSVPARADRMATVRASVAAAARSCGFHAETAEDIVLAVAEACQNVILHTYGGQEGGRLELALFRRQDGILVRLRDSGPPVDVARIRPRDLDEIRPGGLGTHFMRSLMDTVDYSLAPDGAGNILHMTKRLECRDGQ